MVEQPGGGLAMSTTASTTTKGASNPLSSIMLARTLRQRRCYSERCPSHLPRRGDGSTANSETFSRPPRYSRLKAPCLDGAGTPWKGPQRRLYKIERPRCTTASRPPRCTTASGPPRCTTASATDARRKATMMWSAGDGATTMMGQPEATTHTEAVATIVGRTAALLLGHLALESSARPSAVPTSQSGFNNRPTSQSTAARPTPSCGWPITAWLVS